MKSLYALGDIEEKATQWGLWARGTGMGAAMLKVGDGVAPCITDDEGLNHERFMRRLRDFDDQLFDLVKSHYVFDEGFFELAVRYRISESSVRRRHDRALAFLAGMVELQASGADVGSWRHDMIPVTNASKSRRIVCQRAAALTAKKRHLKRQKTVLWAIDYLTKQGERVSKARVAKMSGVSREHISRRYADLF